MVETEKNEKLRVYLLFSLLSSMFLWWGLLATKMGSTFTIGLSSTILLLGHFYFFREAGLLSSLWGAKLKQWVFLFQALCLGGLAFEFAAYSAPLYLGILPTLAFLYCSEGRLHKSRAPLLFMIFLTSFFGLTFIFGNSKLSPGFSFESVFLGTFIIWGIGILKMRGLPGHRQGLGDNSGVDKESLTPQDEKLFFHDLVNQTHGISLFLNHKIDQGISPTIEECKSLLNEVRIIQSLVRDHFGLKHKDLPLVPERVPFSRVRSGLLNVIEHFLPKSKVDVSCEFVGLLADSDMSREVDICPIHGTHFFRIMTNLIKNIAEQKSTVASFRFHYDEKGLFITVKNNIFCPLKNDQKLAENLQKIILEGDQKIQEGSGLGLESVSYLCSSMGGKFRFYVSEGEWTTEIFLPREHGPVTQDQDLRADAPSKVA